MKKFNYLFGPVPSRRLGISLGVDLIPRKVCSLNCVYCEAGKTTKLTTERKEYLPTDKIITEIDEFLKDSPQLDYITFSGAGEPTLHSHLNAIAQHIKNNYPHYKLALITNLPLSEPTIRKEILIMDAILPSLDAATQEVFDKINRSEGLIRNDALIHGLIELSKEFKGKLLLEIFIVPGINDTKKELLGLQKIVNEIHPTEVHINSLDRPGVEDWIQLPTEEELQEIAGYFSKHQVHIVSKFKNKEKNSSYKQDIESAILNYLKRRTASTEDLSNGLQININEVSTYITKLLIDNKIKKTQKDNHIYYGLNGEDNEIIRRTN